MEKIVFTSEEVSEIEELIGTASKLIVDEKIAPHLKYRISSILEKARGMLTARTMVES